MFDPSSRNRFPARPPDGKKILFTSEVDGNSDVIVMKADGNGATNLTEDPAGDSAGSWSPDGKYVVF